jgi:hypothetical protein
MATNYRIELAATAERDYLAFYEKAQPSADGKDISDYFQSVFQLIESALDETLSVSPIKKARALAGSLSFVYRLNLGLVSIYYMAYAEQGVTHILHIGPSQDGADLSRLRQAVAKGEAEEVLEGLGIEKSLVLESDQRDWSN